MPPPLSSPHSPSALVAGRVAKEAAMLSGPMIACAEVIIRKFARLVRR